MDINFLYLKALMISNLFLLNKPLYSSSLKDRMSIDFFSFPSCSFLNSFLDLSKNVSKSSITTFIFLIFMVSILITPNQFFNFFMKIIYCCSYINKLIRIFFIAPMDMRWLVFMIIITQNSCIVFNQNKRIL